MTYPAGKKAFLYAAKSAGLFGYARRRTAHGLRILCYHGVSARDEHLWRPQLFIEPDRLSRRLDFLVNHGYHVLALDEASRLLDQGALPAGSVVLTIDDGFHHVKQAITRCAQRKLPVTIYVTTYHVRHNTPIFRLAFRYMLWKSHQCSLDLSDRGLGAILPDGWRLPSELESFATAVTHHAEVSLTEEGRQEFLSLIGERLGVDFSTIAADRLFTIMSAQEVREAAQQGVDIQLHTHRHRFPSEKDVVDREIIRNREVLAPLTSRPLDHLCYPSGVFSPVQFPWVRAHGIRTATTCEVGLNYRGGEPLRLKRFLDSSAIPDIVFEAEVSGFLELLRKTVHKG